MRFRKINKVVFKLTLRERFLRLTLDSFLTQNVAFIFLQPHSFQQTVQEINSWCHVLKVSVGRRNVYSLRIKLIKVLRKRLFPDMLGPQMEGCFDFCPAPSLKARTAQANTPPRHPSSKT